MRLQGKLKRTQALRAELMRTCVDTANHVMLYIANKLSVTKYRNYKKYIVFIPAVLFTCFGIETLQNVYTEFLTGEKTADHMDFSFIPLAVK